MKICFINVTPEIPERLEQDLYKLAKKIGRPDTEFGIKCTKVGYSRLKLVQYDYFRLLNAPQIIEAMLEAQQEGYDALISNCSLDAGWTEAKEVLDIPTIAITQTTLAYATLLGQRFGIVTLNEPKFVNVYYALLRKYGLEGQAIRNNPVRSMALPSDVAVTDGMKNPQLIIDSVKETATELINDGAEVIMIGCGVYSPICTEAGLTTMMDGKVPVLDPVVISFKIAEVMVDLKRSIGLPTISGLSNYGKIPKDYLNKIRTKFNFPAIE